MKTISAAQSKAMADGRARKAQERSAAADDLARVEVKIDGLTAAAAALIEIATMWFAHAMPVMVRPAAPATVVGPRPTDFSGLIPPTGAKPKPDALPQDRNVANALADALGAELAPEDEDHDAATADFGMSSLLDELTEMAEEDEIPPPPPDEVEVWQRRVSTYRRTRMWMPDWGPLPGQVGCQVPAEAM